MTHSAKTLLAALCAWTLGATAFAGDDFGLWTEAGIEKALGKKFSVGAELGFRANDNLHSASRYNVGLGVSYKPIRALKLGAGYVLISQRNAEEVKKHYDDDGDFNGYNVDHAFWRLKNRFYVDATGKVSAGRFSFSLRERYQATIYQSKDIDREKYRRFASAGYDGTTYTSPYFDEVFTKYEATTDHKDSKTKHYLRSRLGVDYDIRHCPVDPYVTFEISNNLSNGFSVDKRRWTVGADWKLKSRLKKYSHTISLAYVHTSGDDDDDDGNLHALSIGYKFKF